MLAPPTAVQVDVLMQLADTKAVAPAGVPRLFHWEPPSVVPITTDPVARQVASLEQEIPSSAVAAAGTVCGVQVDPPSVVFRITDPGPTEDKPAAVQSEVSGQEMAVKSVTIPGYDSTDHVPPPF